MKVKLKYAHKYVREQENIKALFTDTGFIGKYNIAMWIGLPNEGDIPSFIVIYTN